MKDAKGHGSEARGAHSEGVQQIGVLRVNPKAIDVIAKNALTGFSVRHDTGNMPAAGYQVAVQGRTEEEPLNIKNVAGDVAAHVARNSDLYSNPKMYIGGWNSPYTGKVHLEPSQNIGSRLTAIREGHARNQVSIWDNKRGADIRTGGTGRS